MLTTLNKRDGLIAARASTEDRMLADELLSRMQLRSYGQLVRVLINEKAQQLGVG